MKHISDLRAETERTSGEPRPSATCGSPGTECRGGVPRYGDTSSYDAPSSYDEGAVRRAVADFIERSMRPGAGRLKREGSRQVFIRPQKRDGGSDT